MHLPELGRKTLSRCLVAGLLLASAGCVTSSPYALKSPYAGVFTKGLAVSATQQLPPVFPDGLNRPARDPKRGYFIEFRARNAESYGHASVVFGKLDAKGNVPIDAKGNVIPGRVEISGLAPASDNKVTYSAGHIVPVYASTGPSDGDHEDAYALAKWRVDLDREEFDRTVAIIKRRMQRDKYWNGALNSCVTYLRNIADEMGLKTPLTRHLPESFVQKLGRINS